MKNKLAAVALAATMCAQMGVAMAEDGASAGPLTSSNNTAWAVASFPFRLVTGTAGMALGAVGGGLKGIVETEQQFAEKTYGEADQNPLMVPVGLVGTVVAVPVGFVLGAPEGAVTGGKQGYQLWDSF
ncbi:MAG TPA: hypothetical protein V6C52_12585 [Coleofasciculaceae cyanobacterium]